MRNKFLTFLLLAFIISSIGNTLEAKILPAGCSNTTKFSATTGKPCKEVENKAIKEKKEYVDPVFSKECKKAQKNSEELNKKMNKKKTSSEKADYAVTYVLPAQNQVKIACGLDRVRYESPTAICKDYTYSYSTTRSGTCSWHGGVLIWM